MIPLLPCGEQKEIFYPTFTCLYSEGIIKTTYRQHQWFVHLPGVLRNEAWTLASITAMVSVPALFFTSLWQPPTQVSHLSCSTSAQIPALQPKAIFLDSLSRNTTVSWALSLLLPELWKSRCCLGCLLLKLIKSHHFIDVLSLIVTYLHWTCHFFFPSILHLFLFFTIDSKS